MPGARVQIREVHEFTGEDSESGWVSGSVALEDLPSAQSLVLGIATDCTGIVCGEGSSSSGGVALDVLVLAAPKGHRHTGGRKRKTWVESATQTVPHGTTLKQTAKAWSLFFICFHSGR